MRVITGKARGVQLKTPDGMDTRPTADRVKEAIFSSIQFDIPGAKVLDLFGGTGQLAIEALSRGALAHAIADHGITDVATLKRLTRAGMGRCQGRYCAEHLQRLVGSAPDERTGFAPQMPLRQAKLSQPPRRSSAARRGSACDLWTIR